MSDNTKIEWADATVNAVNGCSVVSPGCTNCYAMRLAGTRMKHHPTREGLTIDSKAGPVWNGQVRLHELALLQPLKWKRPRRIFWNAHGDLFHPAVPDEWIDRVFAVCALTPQHTHMILTKRSARMREYMADAGVVTLRVAMTDINREAQRHSVETLYRTWPLPNVWLGVSVEDQARADERIPDLLATPAAVRFLSCEPLLGPVNLLTINRGNRITLDALRGWHSTSLTFALADGCPPSEPMPILPRQLPRINWVIVGGESGPGARPMHPDWARSIRDQCAGAGVPFHFKQWGDWGPSATQLYARSESAGTLKTMRISASTDRSLNGQTVHHAYPASIPADGMVNGWTMWRTGKARAGRLLDGIEHNGLPGVSA